MPRYAQRAPDGVIIFCSAYSPMKVKRNDNEVTLDVIQAMPLFEKLSDLEDLYDESANPPFETAARMHALVCDLARENALRWKREGKHAIRFLKQDYVNIAERFANRRKTGLSNTRTWDAVISAYVKSTQFAKLRKP